MSTILTHLLFLLLCYNQVNGEEKPCSKLPNAAEPSALSGLRKKLLCRYDSQIPPTNETNKRVGLQIYMDRHRMQFEGAGNRLFSYSFFLLVWHDDRLKWNEGEYKNHSNLYLDTDDIWTPAVRSEGHGYFRHPSFVLVFSSGQVNYLLWWEMVGECTPFYAKWADGRVCTVSFRLGPTDKLRVMETYLLSTTSTDLQTSWGIIEVKKKIDEKLKSGNITDVPVMSKFDKDKARVHLEIHLHRNTAVMDASLFSPAAVLFLLLLASTWISCGASIRLAMLALATLLEIFLLYFATRAIPNFPGRFSDFAVLYRDMILISGATFLEWYVAYLIACKNISLSGLLQSFAGTASHSSHALIRSILFIPLNPPKVQNGTPEGAFLSVILDRITFIILLIVFIVMMSMTAQTSLHPIIL